MADFTKAMVGDAMSLLPGVDVESTIDQPLWYTEPCGRAMTDFGARPKRAMCLGSQMDLIFFWGLLFKLLVVFTFTNSGGDRRTCAESVRDPRGFPSTV